MDGLILKVKQRILNVRNESRGFAEAHIDWHWRVFPSKTENGRQSNRGGVGKGI